MTIPTAEQVLRYSSALRTAAAKPTPAWLRPGAVVRTIRDVCAVGYTIERGRLFRVEERTPTQPRTVWHNPARAMLRPLDGRGELVCLRAIHLEEAAP